MINKEVMKKIDEIDVKWTFRTEITVGLLEDLDLDASQLRKLPELIKQGKMKIKWMREIVNAMIIDGPKITRDSSALVLTKAFKEWASFFGQRRRISEKKQELKGNRTPG
jgi:hypothetical protein